mmetsp:Transcript_34042/g.61038  ORF Transcript_34042/g.61038 Transcript_34042/m.61038 type:complete len:351 (+) Transcript_34042:675-1727(+)
MQRANVISRDARMQLHAGSPLLTLIMLLYLPQRCCPGRGAVFTVSRVSVYHTKSIYCTYHMYCAYVLSISMYVLSTSSNLSQKEKETLILESLLTKKYPMMNDEMKERVMSQFDRCMTNALDGLNNKATIKAAAKEVYIWEWEDPTQQEWIRYPPEIQARLEDTFVNNGASTAKIVTKTDTFVLKFDATEEGLHTQRCVRTGSETSVRRTCKGMLPVYRCVDNVWSFILKGAELTINNRDVLQIPYLKLVMAQEYNPDPKHNNYLSFNCAYGGSISIYVIIGLVSLLESIVGTVPVSCSCFLRWGSKASEGPHSHVTVHTQLQFGSISLTKRKYKKRYVLAVHCYATWVA